MPVLIKKKLSSMSYKVDQEKKKKQANKRHLPVHTSTQICKTKI